MDCSLPGSSVHGIFQARILEWVSMPSSRGSFQSRDRACISFIAPALAGDSLLLSHQRRFDVTFATKKKKKKKLKKEGKKEINLFLSLGETAQSW